MMHRPDVPFKDNPHADSMARNWPSKGTLGVSGDLSIALEALTMLEFTTSQSLLLAFGMPGGWEWIVILLLGLLIFGRKLPEVGRSVGRSIVEFKRGVKGINEEIET